MPKFLNPCADSIGYVHFTWNPVTGCKHGPEVCSCWGICYARAMARRFGKTEDEKSFKPTFHPERLDAPWKLKKPSRIFVCSNADLFGDWVPKEWIVAIIGETYAATLHKFLFLTKNPSRYRKFHFYGNALLGTTINNRDELPRIKLLPDELQGYSQRRFISFEPMLEPIHRRYLMPYNWNHIHWAIIGGFSGNEKASAEIKESAEDISEFMKARGIPVFQKDNLGLKNPLKQFPAGLNL